MANKYHIQFGAAKCKVIKREKGKKSSLKLNGEELEEVSAYKYLGEILNNKGNLSDHIAEVERKIKGATASIISETGNKEFKGIKMQAIWQMVDVITIPMTYACEGWTIGKEENKKLQTIFKWSNKDHPIPPKGPPTTILLSTTCYMAVEYAIMRKTILQAKRTDMRKEDSLKRTQHSPKPAHGGSIVNTSQKSSMSMNKWPSYPKRQALKTQIKNEI